MLFSSFQAETVRTCYIYLTLLLRIADHLPNRRGLCDVSCGPELLLVQYNSSTHPHALANQTLNSANGCEALAEVLRPMHRPLPASLPSVDKRGIRDLQRQLLAFPDCRIFVPFLSASLFFAHCNPP